ncbi:MAG: hypothetical protein MUQ56_00605 [Thermoleophilia bacterium]|jgi:hypothetical protein|nr:hypothetical protein [Thermoleophilia bacterium]
MNAPPAVVEVHVAEAGGRRLHLWLPVFVLWPLLVLVGGLAIAVAALADAVLFAMGRPHRFTLFVLGCFDAVGETRGTQVFVENRSRTVDVTVR